MQVVSREEGFFLVFEDITDLNCYVENLKEMADELAATKQPGPHVYAVYAAKPVRPVDINIALQDLRRRFMLR